VDSGVRCAYWNARNGVGEDGEHRTGEAVDILCTDSSLRYLLLKLGMGIFTRVGIYKDLIHFGVSPDQDQDIVWHCYK